MVLYTQAGPEISVASTKAMCSQMVLLALMALYYGQRRTPAVFERELLVALHALPEKLSAALPAMQERAEQLALRFASSRSFFYLGRGQYNALALEGALKLKELSYIHAEGYAAGEMKHGPIALIDPQFPTFALALDDVSFPKVKSNIQEVLARQGARYCAGAGRRQFPVDSWCGRDMASSFCVTHHVRFSGFASTSTFQLLHG